jgi:CheY-like chemotaxis protein
MSAQLQERKTRILLIEDNPADVYLLQRALDEVQLNFELTVIEDGADALALARQSGKYTAIVPPDLAIIDLNLPKHGGLEVLEEMRANPAFADLPVMILSSSSTPHERARMEKCRIRQFVTKPPDLEEYLRIGLVVKQLLVERRASTL